MKPLPKTFDKSFIELMVDWADGSVDRVLEKLESSGIVKQLSEEVAGELVNIRGLPAEFEEFNGKHGVSLSRMSPEEVPSDMKDEYGDSWNVVEFPGIPCNKTGRWLVRAIPSKYLFDIAEVSRVTLTYAGDDLLFHSVDYTDSCNESKKYRFNKDLEIIGV